ncbi:MAG: hypothetical protein COA57_04730 [Flavobacteriales bacterium]|nr:MAG: hypothetical protein COA57_04730 [Flavobacteriales bacterium]
MSKNQALIFAFLFFIIISSCQNRIFFEENVTITNEVWNTEGTPVFEVNVTDTLSFHNFFINIRNTGDYEFMNLWVFVTTTFPNGRNFRDTIECPLADASGKWLGASATGSIFDSRIELDNKILYNTNIRFPMRGKYVFRFEQAMRRKELENITDVGLRIEKSN